MKDFEVTIKFNVESSSSASMIAALSSFINAMNGEAVPVVVEGPAQIEEQVEETLPNEVEQVAKSLTTEDVRAAMHRARMRIEGEDYKDNPESDGYKSWHKAMTAQFKLIAGVVSNGATNTPSKLSEECRAAFISECDNLIIKDDIIITETPF